MKLQFIALASLISNINLSSSAESSTAQPIPADTAQCRSALLKGKSKIENLKTKVVRISRFKHSYDDSPTNKPLAYTFAMTGPATQSVMLSKNFLTDISNNIVSTCPSVSLLIFGFDMSDYSVTLGLMNNGKVQQFSCIEARRENITPIRWGQVICL